jgi:hypothetical protein
LTAAEQPSGVCGPERQHRSLPRRGDSREGAGRCGQRTQARPRRVPSHAPTPVKPQEGASEGELVGAGARPLDVSTTGNASGYVPQPVTVAPTDWKTSPYAQIEGGFLGGLALGFVPFGGLGHQVLDAADVLPHGEPDARRGMAVRQIMGGIVTLVGGATGEVIGGFATTAGSSGSEHRAALAALTLATSRHAHLPAGHTPGHIGI